MVLYQRVQIHVDFKLHSEYMWCYMYANKMFGSYKLFLFTSTKACDKRNEQLFIIENEPLDGKLYIYYIFV